MRPIVDAFPAAYLMRPSRPAFGRPVQACHMKAGCVREQELTSEKNWQRRRYGASSMGGACGRSDDYTNFGQGQVVAQERTVLRAMGGVPMA